MALDNNPLKQYFRRPAIYLRLPSGGKGYAPGVIEMTETGELPVYPMTAIDEITSKTPDALFNGVAIVEVIKSCIPAIIDPWSISSVDLDAILIAVRSAASGNELEIETTCPKCDESSKYGVNLVGLLSRLKSGDYDQELPINELLIKFRPLTFKEMNQASLGQFELQRMFNVIHSLDDMEEKNRKTKEALASITDTTMQVLSHTIAYIKTPTAFVDNNDYILDFLRNCDKTIYEQVKKHNAELKEQTEVKPLDIKCVSCGHDYQQQFSLNASDFFD
jgi:hypothetical protein